MTRLFFLLLAVLFLTGIKTASALTLPECSALKNWAAGIPLPANHTNVAQVDTANAHVAVIFSDEQTSALFGAPRSGWSERDVKEVRAQLNYCQQALYHMRDQDGSAKVAYALTRLDLVSTTPKRSSQNLNIRVGKPECPRIARWAHEGGSFPEGTSYAKRTDWMFNDQNMVSLFGLSFRQWSVFDMAQAHKYIVECRLELYPRGSTLSSDDDKQTYMGFDLVKAYITGAQTRSPDYRKLTRENMKQLQ